MELSIISEKLEDIRNYIDVELHPVVSPDRWDVYSELRDMVDDIITLLKAQEPRLVINIHKAYNNVLNPDVPWVGKCPKCGKRVSGKNLTRFCMYCGQAVKWE